MFVLQGLGIAVTVLGIVVKLDSNITGDYANAMYLQLYACGFQLTRLLTTFYSVAITCGVLTMASSTFGLTDLCAKTSGYKKTVIVSVQPIADIKEDLAWHVLLSKFVHL